jgi:hypothetical protein
MLIPGVIVSVSGKLEASPFVQTWPESGQLSLSFATAFSSTRLSDFLYDGGLMLLDSTLVWIFFFTMGVGALLLMEEGENMYYGIETACRELT